MSEKREKKNDILPKHIVKSAIEDMPRKPELNPVEKIISDKYGDLGLEIFGFVDGQKTAKKIVSYAGCTESKLIEILDFMDERGMIKLAFPTGTPPDLCSRECVRIKQLTGQLSGSFGDFDNFGNHQKAERTHYILNSVPVKNAIKSIEELKPRNNLDAQEISITLQAASLTPLRWAST